MEYGTARYRQLRFFKQSLWTETAPGAAHAGTWGKVDEPQNTHRYEYGEIGVILDELGFTERILVDGESEEGELINKTLGWNGVAFIVARIPEAGPEERVHPAQEERPGFFRRLGRRAEK